MINYKKEIEKISNWMKEYLKNSECNGYVCGISGGVDSALVGSLCAKACKGKVIFINLPCQSSPCMEEDALELANNLGIELKVFNLIDSYNIIIKELEAGGETVSQLTKANTKARLRMTMLFAIANQYNYLVAGTGNLSELSIGYCTFGGDHCVSIEPIGNYYKTEIYKMAELMTEIPKKIIIKTPSADLWEGQTDEKEFGMSYKKLDTILQIFDIFGKVWCNEWEKINITRDEFKKIKFMMKKAKYKNEVPHRCQRSFIRCPLLYPLL